MIEALRYKLRCFGIPVEDPAKVFCDNMSVVKNLNIPTSALKKRNNAIFYHRIGRLRIQLFSDLGDFQESLIWKTCLQRQQCLEIQGIIWLIQSSLIEHFQLVIFIRRKSIYTWVHLSTAHTITAVAKSGSWACIYIYIIKMNHLWLSICGN